jgi:selenide,water dikinase
MGTERIRLTAYSHGAGCACKLGPSDLATVLGGLSPAVHPDLVVGTEWGDDAAVWRRPDGRLSIATLDFFTPIVDDARLWGAIAATNAASDVYAMGGTPQFGLNIVAWPIGQLPLELLGEVLNGAREVADRGGWFVVGGHSVDGAEPLYGQAVVGEAAEEELLTNAGGRPGQALVLTKAIGTGLVSTAVKRSDPGALEPGGWLEPVYREAVASMTTLNADAARAAHRAGATAATDITGFGLLGHLHKLALASGVRAVLDVAAIPRLAGVEDLAAAGHVPGGTGRNHAYVRAFLDDACGDEAESAAAGEHLPGVASGEPGRDAARSAIVVLLADPQTSGGLLFACPPDRATEAVAELRALGQPAALVGGLEVGRAGEIVLR